MSINKLLTITLCILIGIIFIEGIYYLSLIQRRKVQIPTINSQLSNFKILYQASGDKEGRTLIYNDFSKKFSGVGDFYDQSKKLTHLIGLFKGWGKITGSKDLYIKLENPLNKKISIPKARIVIDLLKNKKVKKETRLGLDKLNSKKIIFQELIKNVEIVNNLILEGDVIIIIPFIDDKGNNITDKNSVILARWLLIRRNN